MMPQTMGQAPIYFCNADSKQQQHMGGAILRQAHGLPANPPTLYSNGPALLTPAGGSPPITNRKPSIMLETDLAVESYFPATPPLSTAGSSVGSPKSFDMLQTPMNPMFSGLDGVDGSKDIIEPADLSSLDWSSCGSPPMTPVYLPSQISKAISLNTAGELFAPASCPSLSPSPAPYARSIAASEQDVDFCDPRNLTVSGVAPVSNLTLTPECSFLVDAEPTSKNSGVITTAISQQSFDFSSVIPDNLPTFNELGDLESEDDFVSSLVNLGDSFAGAGRPRACTGSSVVSLGHGSFIGEEDLSFDENDSFQSPSLLTPVSIAEDAHKDKRQKKSHKKDNRVAAVTMSTAAGETQSADSEQTSKPVEDDDATRSDDESNGSSSSEGGAAPLPAPVNRRGRKQSLTEDPSKTFVCDLCSRRFRRQEHLKRHYRSLHTQEKPFECNECGKKFSRSDNLAQHARTHAGGAVVVDLIGDNGAFEAGLPPAPLSDDHSAYGKVLFQIASEVPGSASEPSSDEDKDDGKKKRKRSD